MVVVAGDHDGPVAGHAQRRGGPHGQARLVAPHPTAAVEAPRPRQGVLAGTQLDSRLVLSIAAALRPDFALGRARTQGQEKNDDGGGATQVHRRELSLGTEALATRRSLSFLAPSDHTSTTFKAEFSQ